MKNEDKILKEALGHGLKLGARDVEIYIEKSRSKNLELRKGQLEKSEDAASIGVGIRVLRGQKEALVFRTSLEEGSLEKAVEEAYEMAPYLDENPHLTLGEAGEYRGAQSPGEDAAMEAAPEELKTHFLQRLEEQAVRRDVVLEGISYSEEHYLHRIINNRGLDKEESGAWCGASVSLAIQKKGISETGYSYLYTRSLDKLLKRKLGNEAYSRAREMLGAGSVTTGKYPVIFHREVAASLLGLLAHSFSGENLYKGKSLFTGKEGERVLSEKLQIIDDGTMEGVLGAKAFDGDGTVVRRNKVIQDGVFLGGLYNLSMAAKAGRETTGNSSRSFASLPGVGRNSLYIPRGQVSRKDMLSVMTKGLIIRDLMGLHMANPVTGEFSLGASGLLVENGRIRGSFRGVTVSGNLKELFSNLEGIGRDFRFETTLGAPSLFVKDVIISGS